MSRHRCAGFTLVEVLLAVALLAVLSVLAWRAIDAMARARDETRARNRHWRELALCFERFGQDVGQAVARPLGAVAGGGPAWMRGGLPGAGLVFVRRQPGPGGDQPVGYRLEHGRVERLAWDGPTVEATRAVPLLDAVDAMQVRFLDADGTWRIQWPAPDGAPVVRLPRAVALELTPRGSRAISRVYALP